MSSKDDDHLRDNPLADQLANLNIEVSDDSDGPDDSPPSTEDQTPPDDRELTDEELFEQAVKELDPAQVYAGKYQGRAGAPLPDEPSPKPRIDSVGTESDEVDDEQARHKIQDLRDAALFEKMVGSVEPLHDRDKYRLPRRKQPPPASQDEPNAEDVLLTPLLPRSGEGLNYVPRHDDSQRALMARYRKYEASRDVPELNLRGQTRARAREMIREFIPPQRRAGAPFVRIITGRGLRSESEPVLKPTILDWLHGPGLDHIRGYAPERTLTGDYGSLIVELSANDERT